MKIAVVTDDGMTVSQHFGQARYYAVLTIEEQRVSGRRMLDRGDTLQAVAEHQARQGLSGVIDCHGTGTAAAAAYRAEGRPMTSEPSLRFLTASLRVEYVNPTPLGVPLEVRGSVKEIKGRRVVVEVWISANGIVTVRGEVIAVQVPEMMLDGLAT